MTDDERTAWLRNQLAEMDKYQAETRKLDAEARHFDRQFWLVVIGAVSAAAALFAAGAAFMKLVMR